MNLQELNVLYNNGDKLLKYAQTKDTKSRRIPDIDFLTRYETIKAHIFQKTYPQKKKKRTCKIIK